MKSISNHFQAWDVTPPKGDVGTLDSVVLVLVDQQVEADDKVATKPPERRYQDGLSLCKELPSGWLRRKSWWDSPRSPPWKLNRVPSCFVHDSSSLRKTEEAKNLLTEAQRLIEEIRKVPLVSNNPVSNPWPLHVEMMDLKRQADTVLGMQ